MPDHITVYEAADGWRWRCETADGEVVAKSGSAWKKRVTAEGHAVREAKDNDLTIDVEPALTEGD